MTRWIVPFIYLVALTTAVGVTSFVIGAWSFRHVNEGGRILPEWLGAFVVEMAQVPSNLKLAYLTLATASDSVPKDLIIEEARWKDGVRADLFPDRSDPGYLLFSGVDGVSGANVVQLLRIATGEEVVRWSPDWRAVHAASEHHRFAPKGLYKQLLALHPLVLDDASIIFNTGSVLARLKRCEQHPEWILNGIYHHSNELAGDGTFWTPSVNQEISPAYQHSLLREQLRDDSLANYTKEGKLIENRSFAKILRDNGLEHLIFGFGGLGFQDDPIHLNQITPALEGGRFWARGDLLISARHLSTVFLYRPSTNKIIWYKTGPWLNQHSVMFVGEESISVFDNNVFGANPTLEPPFQSESDTNRFWVFNFSTNALEQPYATVLQAARVRTVTEGRGHIVSGNRLFVEETNFGRHLMLTETGVQWSRLNHIRNDEDLGRVAWSRYIEAEVGDRLAALAQAQPCTPTPER
jgi:hypothetical protein